MKTIDKTNNTQINTITYTFFKLVFLCFLFLQFSCSSDESCEYITGGPVIPPTCDLQSELNLSTGIDTNGNVLTPGKGIVDPFWRVINNPPLLSCSDPLVSTINGDAYVINFANFGPDGWVNQTGSTTLAPMDLGTTDTFGCNNASNNNGDKVPYVFERPFCILEDTCIDFSFTLKGDDQVYLELIDNSNNFPIDTSPTYIWSNTGIQTWSTSNLCLSSGSYSLRAYLVNTNATVLGFSLVGNLVTTNGDASISNNVEGCCQNNVISVLNILEENCDSVFDNGVDQLGNGWSFILKDISNTIIRTETTDANGNVFFSGLEDGTYTVEIVNQTGWISSNPSTGTITVTVANNEATILEFFSCIN
ncbi:SpaA isopeptide-forming pilin-related protein [Oceanihabitans sp. 2_MG-2023]|uniref:SdrD B-like domain-containing protein n=1 Tax=Oceanihabitans sp. 2_MG-2023 TaxID=3062661 RepID=UPI0026E11654|nr:SpaA isopeptide-forming pilin-related protein [Oceanihabitans sp. 2_MG-2023]MDO6595275.1 SpaA isopeptide-forming pilin-related protein [Oceanihabitans sp. 2_MG-2023]